MLKINKFWILITVVLILVFMTCSQRVYKIAYPTLNDGKYDSEFPYKSCSDELKKITESVSKVFCNVQYKNYIFDFNKKVLRHQLKATVFGQADRTFYFHQTVSGTGAVIYNDGTKAAVLTCAHIFHKPDTIFNYFADSYLTDKRYLQSVAIKVKQENLVTGFPGDANCYVLLEDKLSDVMLLAKTFIEPPQKPITVLDYNFGTARELEWGSFVYLIGYPRGYKIVTKGIVSNPDRDKKGSFLIDALFNTGMSGGIILAIRDGVPNFEIVGVTTAAAAEQGTVLVPDSKVRDYDETIPYDGKIFVNNKKDINYGITLAISAEVILDMIKSNEQYLSNKGFHFSLLKEKEK